MKANPQIYKAIKRRKAGGRPEKAMRHSIQNVSLNGTSDTRCWSANGSSRNFITGHEAILTASDIRCHNGRWAPCLYGNLTSFTGFLRACGDNSAKKSSVEYHENNARKSSIASGRVPHSSMSYSLLARPPECVSLDVGTLQTPGHHPRVHQTWWFDYDRVLVIRERCVEGGERQGWANIDYLICPKFGHVPRL
ncbi:hypothetical protein RRG08_024267 [Elysia crispata]|uniref:Uncharacterized protein n=1 Tax=Elysia crispata TaxID=231223 RepID=A0AAE1D976_9GAST|nr:hypothetical protein RRG08_024267 [Elysia crispata]